MEYNEKLFDSIINKMITAFAYHEIILDDEGIPIDFKYIRVNEAFEAYTGLKKENVVNKTVNEILPNSKDKEIWIRDFGKVALTGEPLVLEHFINASNRWYQIDAWSPERGKFIAMFIDISNIKSNEQELMKKNEELTKLYDEITDSKEELRIQLKQLNNLYEQISKSEYRLTKAQEIAHVGNWEVDLDTWTLWASKEAYKLYGIDIDDCYYDFKKVQQYVIKEDRKRMDEALEKLINEGEEYDELFRVERRDINQIRYMHAVAEVECDDNGKPSKILGVVRDVTDKVLYEEKMNSKNQELAALYEQIAASEEELKVQVEQIQWSNKQLELSEHMYRTLVNNSEDVIYSCDCNGFLTAVNSKFCEVTDILETQIIGKSMKQVFNNAEYYDIWNENFMKALETSKSVALENRVILKNGEERYYSIVISPIIDSKNNVVGITGTNHDITNRKENEAKILHMAYHDPLTGLPHRTFLFNKLNNAIINSQYNNTKVVVIFLDLDNFKKINDTLGHVIGDELLKDVARRISACMSTEDTIARLGGDEFSVLIQDVQHISEVIEKLEELKSIFEEPFNIDGNLINLTGSIGVALYPEDGVTADDLLKHADTAMYKAKELGRNTYQFFNVKMKDELLRKITIESKMREALKKNEFLLYYQPQYETKTKSLRGFEALIRWNNSELGFLRPDEFIPIAEETGLIIPIGQWVLKTAIEMNKNIKAKYGKDIKMSINISPIQIKQKDFYESVLKAIKESEVEVENLELEVTESVFIDEGGNSIEVLNKLRELGIKIALDDFGTGYSSLSYLKKLPITLLKIDKSFVDEIGASNSDTTLIESIISLVHKLNIKTLAEGVETKEQLLYLERAQCDSLQGYHLGKPVPEHMLEEIIINGKYA